MMINLVDLYPSQEILKGFCSPWSIVMCLLKLTILSPKPGFTHHKSPNDRFECGGDNARDMSEYMTMEQSTDSLPNFHFAEDGVLRSFHLLRGDPSCDARPSSKENTA